MTPEQHLEEKYPSIEWREPFPLEIVGGRKGFACRFCIALIGYRPDKNQLPGFSENREEVTQHIEKEHIMSNYLKTKPNGDLLENEKSPDLAAFCDEELHELPQFETIPAGLILIACVDNGGFEAAMVVDNEYDYSRINKAIQRGDPRPVRFFLIKREWVAQMAEKPLEGA